MGAGDATMAARFVGDYGGIEMIAADDLRDPLISVGQMLDKNMGTVIVFTPNGAYSIPLSAVASAIAAYEPIAERAPNGLYQTMPQRVKRGITRAQKEGSSAETTVSRSRKRGSSLKRQRAFPLSLAVHPPGLNGPGGPRRCGRQ